jgi:hypothetical protein
MPALGRYVEKGSRANDKSSGDFAMFTAIRRGHITREHWAVTTYLSKSRREPMTP